MCHTCQRKNTNFITHYNDRFPHQYPCNSIQQGPLLISRTPTNTNPNLNFENYIVQSSRHSKPKREFCMCTCWIPEREREREILHPLGLRLILCAQHLHCHGLPILVGLSGKLLLVLTNRGILGSGSHCTQYHIFLLHWSLYGCDTD
jgi:hypothetical protein